MRRAPAAMGAAALAVSILTAAGCGGISTKSTQPTTTRRPVDAASLSRNAPPTGTTVAPNPPPITLNKFGSIEYGMTLDKVIATFGSPGTVDRSSDSDRTESRSWDGSPGSDGFAVIVFRDGIVFGKTQMGLS